MDGWSGITSTVCLIAGSSAVIADPGVPADADDGVTQDQQRPFLPDHVERALDGAVLGARLEPLHSAIAWDLTS
ncbi:hypothetical protein GCM10022232_82470 [Streptomyces plumbiresistens]|uniref:Uncharacterized protein n=1 Tax=Streptomyces plumbiresistens TaxID=511811 RepID=A0ABP7TD44_9ACTN